MRPAGLGGAKSLRPIFDHKDREPRRDRERTDLPLPPRDLPTASLWFPGPARRPPLFGLGPACPTLVE